MMEIIEIKKTANYHYFLRDKKNITFHVKKDCEIDIDLFDNRFKLTFLIEKAKVKINIFSRKNIHLNSNFVLTKADLIINGLSLVDDSQFNVKLQLEKSHVQVYHRVFTAKNNKNNLRISHNSVDCYSDVQCVILGDEKAHIDVETTTVVKKNCPLNKAFQNSQIIALNHQVTGQLQPILKIANNQIQAAHAAVFKKISDDEMYYLLSRGLSKKAAKNLIIKSYLSSEKYYQIVEELF